jgi:hypothetical protein
MEVGLSHLLLGSRTLIAVALLSGCLSYGQATNWTQVHAQDDARWAKRSGLPVEQVRQLRSAAGIGDDSSGLIDNIDARTLAPYSLVLFAAFEGSARCVDFWLLSKTKGGFEKFWSSEEGGDELNFCADPKCQTPIAEAEPNRDLKIVIPAYDHGRCVSDSFALLKWTGREYSYKGIITKKRAH